MAAGCMKVPSGLHVNVTTSGCTTQGVCPYNDGKPHNWYDAASREIVVAPGQSLVVIAHEACHAHQHQVILDETGKEPAQVVSSFNADAQMADLREWLTTTEAIAYTAVREVAGPAPWGDYGIVLLEDFASSCGRFLTDQPLDAVRGEFFSTRGFK